MAIDFEETLTRGGKPCIDFLQFCLATQRLDAIFLLLAREYRNRPTPAGALALYDIFFAEKAMARLPLPVENMPPRNPRLTWQMDRIKQNLAEVAAFKPTEEDPVPPPPLPPPMILFDEYAKALRAKPDLPCLLAAQQYNPDLEPVENLPGGVLTIQQKLFLKDVWCGRIRPVLSQAGFWRISSLGQL